MRRPIVLALAVVAAMGAAAAVTAQVVRTSESAGVSKVERFLRDAQTGGSCSFDACGIRPPAAIPYTTPTSVQAVDVTVTITFRYRTSRGHQAFAGLSVNEGTSGTPMQPRRNYPLAPAAKETTTTLTWFKKDLPAAGKEYTFELSAVPPFVQGRSFVSARRLTVVIESWTAGD
jgi:hypothetical protein